MIKIGIDTNEKNQVIVAYDDEINGDIRLNIPETVYNQIFLEGIPFKYTSTGLIVDTTKQEYELIENQKKALEDKLKNTNNAVYEFMELQLLGEEIPEELFATLNHRASWREEINRLDLELKNL